MSIIAIPITYETTDHETRNRGRSWLLLPDRHPSKLSTLSRFSHHTGRTSPTDGSCSHNQILIPITHHQAYTSQAPGIIGVLRLTGLLFHHFFHAMDTWIHLIGSSKEALLGRSLYM
jgi:hypothetical protein